MFCERHISKVFLLFLFFSFQSHFTQATHWPFRTGARSAALSGVSLCHSDVWAVQNNQAAMAFTEGAAIGLDFSNPFLLRELSRVNLSAVMPVKNMQVGVNINQLGFEIWQENKLGFALARKMGKDWSMGIGVHYHTTRYNDRFFSDLHGVSAELGLLYRHSAKLQSAFHLLQPMAYFRVEEHYRFIRPQVRAGLSYELYEELKLYGETALTDNAPLSSQLALEYRYGKALDLRLSYRFQPDQLAFGAGYQFGHSLFDIAFSWHPQLGFTPSVSLSHEF